MFFLQVYFLENYCISMFFFFFSKKLMSSQMVKKGIVKLNVGGDNFITSSTTLSHSRYFEKLLSTRVGIQYDEDGRIFIDRSGKTFQEVLSFLRDKQIHVKAKDDLICLKEEAVFYQMDDLITEIDRILFTTVDNNDGSNSRLLLLSIEDLNDIWPTTNSSFMTLSDMFEFIMTIKTTDLFGDVVPKLLVRVKNQ